MINRHKASNSLQSELSRLNVDKKLDYTPYVSGADKLDVTSIRRKFKLSLEEHHKECQITGMKFGCIASHIKPLASCRTLEECVDPANGLYLAKTIDELFDKGWISFDADGSLLASEAFAADWGIEELTRRIPIDWFYKKKLAKPNCEKMADRQETYLRYHRYNVFQSVTGWKSSGSKAKYYKYYSDDKNVFDEEYIQSLEKFGGKFRYHAQSLRRERERKTGVVYCSGYGRHT